MAEKRERPTREEIALSFAGDYRNLGLGALQGVLGVFQGTYGGLGDAFAAVFPDVVEARREHERYLADRQKRD